MKRLYKTLTFKPFLLYLLDWLISVLLNIVWSFILKNAWHLVGCEWFCTTWSWTSHRIQRRRKISGNRGGGEKYFHLKTTFEELIWSFGPQTVASFQKTCSKSRCSCLQKKRHIDLRRPHRQELCGRCKDKRFSCGNIYSFKCIMWQAACFIRDTWTLLVIYCIVPLLHLGSDLVLENGLGFCTFCRWYDNCRCE